MLVPHRTNDWRRPGHDMPTPQEILAELKNIKYPGFTRDIASFGMVKDIEVAHAGVTILLTTASAQPEMLAQIAAEVERVVGAMPGVPAVKVEIQRAAAPPPMAAS